MVWGLTPAIRRRLCAPVRVPGLESQCYLTVKSCVSLDKWLFCTLLLPQGQYYYFIKGAWRLNDILYVKRLTTWMHRPQEHSGTVGSRGSGPVREVYLGLVSGPLYHCGQLAALPFFTLVSLHRTWSSEAAGRCLENARAATAPPSGLSRGEALPSHWESEGHSVVSNSLRRHGLYSPWGSPGQNTGVGRLCLLQGNFPTQWSNPSLPHCRWIPYQL